MAMKAALFVFFTLWTVTLGVTLGVSTAAHAQKPLKVITYDSIGADAFSVFFGTQQDTANLVGFPNGSNVELSNTGEWVFAKFYHGGLTAVDFQQGATIELYWNRNSNDSSHAWVILYNYFENWIPKDGTMGDTISVTQSGTAPQVYRITVPAAGYNTVEVHLENHSDPPIFLDAIVLKQHGTIDSVGNTSGVDAPLAEAAGFSCYPNPFLASSGTTLHAPETQRDAQSETHGEYIVMDLLGREVARLNATSDARFIPPATGVYFVRRLVSGEWTGAPLRISAE